MATIQPSLSQIKHLPAQSFLSGAEPLKELNNLTGNGGLAMVDKHSNHIVSKNV